MIDEDAIRYRWETVGCTLDERGRLLFAAAEVRAAGWGGLAVVSKITGLARSTINLRIPGKATTRSGAWRPPIPGHGDQCGAGCLRAPSSG